MPHVFAEGLAVLPDADIEKGIPALTPADALKFLLKARSVCAMVDLWVCTDVGV